ncbi:hypothetical protein GCM10009603_35860 [Nocardiopsis exhalans]
MIVRVRAEHAPLQPSGLVFCLKVRGQRWRRWATADGLEADPMCGGALWSGRAWSWQGRCSSLLGSSLFEVSTSWGLLPGAGAELKEVGEGEG